MGSEMSTQTQTVVRDATGAVINIGPWDYQMQPAPILAVGGELVDDGPEIDAQTGEPTGERKTREAVAGELLGYDAENPIATNPLPDGATITEEAVTERDDGGLAAEDDYRSLRRIAYPPLADQLDAYWKGGAAADAMRDKIMAVKARFPKPEGA